MAWIILKHFRKAILAVADRNLDERLLLDCRQWFYMDSHYIIIELKLKAAETAKIGRKYPWTSRTRSYL